MEKTDSGGQPTWLLVPTWIWCD